MKDRILDMWTMTAMCCGLMLSSGCKKVIQIPVNNAAPVVVINGEVSNQPGPYVVTITSSVGYDADNQFPAVSGAVVTIRDNTGLYDSLREGSPGVYQTQGNWQGQPGNSYALSVTVAGATYTGVSTMPQPVALDSVGFVQSPRGRRNTDVEINAIPYFQDPVGIANYYEYRETINGTPLNETFIFSDRLSDGRYIAQPARDDSAHLAPGDQLAFSMYCIDANTFNYLLELERDTDPGVFSAVTPSNPVTNLTGGALGFFSAHTAQTRQTIVHLP